jgi:hypothetical protein
VRHFRGVIANFMLCSVMGIVTAMAVGCGTGGELPRIPPADSGFAAAVLPNRKDGSPYPATGFFGLCLDRPGSVEIVDVVLENSEGGLKIDAFALTPKNGEELPTPVTFTETLAELGFRLEEKTLHTQCPSGGTAAPEDESSSEPPLTEGAPGYTDLAVQFSKPASMTARGGIINVKYKSGDDILSHRIGFSIVLCEGDSDKHKIPGCEYSEYGWE